MKIVKKLLTVVIVLGLVYFLYLFFYKINKVTVDFDQAFTLKMFDQAKVKDQITFKLIRSIDNRCLDKSCEREGQIVYKVLALTDKRIEYLTISSVEKPNVEIKKTDYVLTLVEAKNAKEATFKLTIKEEEKK